MTRRTRTVVIMVAAFILQEMAIAATLAQVPDFQPRTQPRLELPFSTPETSVPGPPRAMGLPPLGQGDAPSDLIRPGSGPPRAMGTTPFRPPGISPLLPNLPGFSPNQGQIAPGITPGFQPLPSATSSGLADNLLLLPGLLGQNRGQGEEGQLQPDDLVDEPLSQDSADADQPPREAPRVDDKEVGPELRLDRVLASAEGRYPLFRATLEEREVAEGKITSELGSFDLSINIDSQNYPLGFYDRYLEDFFIEQPILQNGGKVFAGYRLAQGHWPTYYNYLNTLDGGAFVAGFELPLLQGRAIDPKRAKLFQAEIERRKVEPTILKERIELLKDASKAYWYWISAGQALAIYQDLLELTEFQYQGVIRLGELQQTSPLSVIAFQNTVYKRQQQVIAAERDYRNAAITLSFYLRDEHGFPIIPDSTNIPAVLPLAVAPDTSAVDHDLVIAQRLRPEIFSLRLEYDKAAIDRDLAENLLLPSLNFYLYSEQNVGNFDVDLEKDFRPFILSGSFFFEVPLQRRFARGRIRTTEAILRQIKAQTQFTGDQIRNDVLTALTELKAAYDSLTFYRNSETISRELARKEQRLIELELTGPLLFFVVSQQVLEIQAIRVLAEGKYFAAAADYRAVLGLDAVLPELHQVVPEVTMIQSEDLGPEEDEKESTVPPPSDPNAVGAVRVNDPGLRVTGYETGQGSRRSYRR